MFQTEVVDISKINFFLYFSYDEPFLDTLEILILVV
jgi:hypothetical protein